MQKMYHYPVIKEAKKENHSIESYLKEEFSKMKQEAIDIADKKYGRQTKLFQ